MQDNFVESSEKSSASEHHASDTSKRPVGPEHPRVRFLAMALLLMLSVGGGFLGGYFAKGETPTTVEKQQVVLKSQGQVISNIAQTVGESVVSVNTTATVTTQNFFGFAQDNLQEGAGTGIILTSEGLIITNRHVVPQGTTEVSVTLSDGTVFEDVTVVGRTGAQDSLDIAFLKINGTRGKKLKAASLGDSAKMQVGESVIAIGNALGQFQNTVTAGILSGYGRSVQAGSEGDTSVENLEDLIQTDAAINPGNSGGPLVNLDGEVIGINTAVAGNAENIGFAIPINDVVGLIDSVKATGKLERPYLGVYYVPLTNDLAEAYGLKVKRGAYIAPEAILGTAPVIKGGPADKAGLQAGDVIVKINGKSIDEHNSLSAHVNKYKVGEKIELTVFRDGKEIKISVTLGAAPTN